MTMFLLFAFLLYGLAAYRFTILLTDEDGPYELFKRLRESQGIVHLEFNDPETGSPVKAMTLEKNATLLGKILYCQHCASGWITFVLAGLYSGMFIPLKGTLILVTFTIILWIGMWGFVRLLIKNMEG